MAGRACLSRTAPAATGECTCLWEGSCARDRVPAAQGPQPDVALAEDAEELVLGSAVKRVVKPLAVAASGSWTMITKL